ncbi:MAG: zinc-ribbon domain-containing protein, partial [Thiobacillus sp.]
MNYRTTCPRCASIFRIGGAQLAAADGWAQCSVCGAAFDVRPSLRREDGSPLPSTNDAPKMPSPQAPRTESPADASAAPPEPASAAAPASGQAAPAATAVEARASDDGLPQGIVRHEHGHELDSIILIDPDAAPPDDPGPLPQIPPAGA